MKTHCREYNCAKSVATTGEDAWRNCSFDWCELVLEGVILPVLDDCHFEVCTFTGDWPADVLAQSVPNEIRLAEIAKHGMKPATILD